MNDELKFIIHNSSLLLEILIESLLKNIFNVTREQQYIFYFCDFVNFALRVEEFSFYGNYCIYNITQSTKNVNSFCENK